MRCVYGGDHYANLIVSSNDPITPVDSVLCYLNVIATPDIVLSTDTLDFDVVFVDYADTIAFQVYNIGSDTLDVSNITTDNANYSVNTTNFSLPPDENQTVLVIFAPTVVGVSSGNLTVHSNDANNPAVNVVLIGEGVDAPIIHVYPEYISDTLFTGESANHNLTVGNIGGSDLSFEISIASLPPALERMQETVVIADSKHNGYSNDLVNTPYIGNNESVSIDRNNKDASRTEFLQMERNTIVRSPEPVPNSFSQLRTEYENYALKFDGVDDYVNLPTLTPITSTPINKFTFEGWINVFAPTNDIQQFMEGHTSTWEIFVELETGMNPMVFHIHDNSGAGYTVQTSPISFSTWHHIAATYDGYDQRIYLDGVLQDSISWSNTFTITTGITLGKDFDISSQYLNGLIDEVRIWSVARTQSEIQANMYRQIFGNEPGLICYWRLNEGTGYTAFDQTSNHNNGSLQGGVAWTASTAPILPAWLTASPDSGTVPAASSMDVDICFNAAQMYGGDYHANLVILSNDPSTPEDTVLCFLHVIAAPDIDLSTDTLNFDSVLVNHSDSLELQVFNIGADTLLVSDIKTDNVDYSVDTTNFALLPYEHQTVLVMFTPSTSGSITGNLIVLSNDPDEPADTVALHGIGMTGITEEERAVPAAFFIRLSPAMRSRACDF
jgi:hypothetical protein